MHKAHPDGQHDIFEPHENPFIRDGVEAFTESGMFRLSAIRQDLDAWLTGQKFTGHAALPAPPAQWLYLPQWTQAQADAIDAYLSGLPIEAFTGNDYGLLVKLLVYRHMPEGALIDEALSYAAQNLALGAAQSQWQAQNSDAAIPQAQLARLHNAMPSTLDGIATALRLSETGQAMVQYGAARAAENVVALADDTRRALQNTLMDWQVKKTAGDPAATVAKLQQTLFDKFATLNRDWRRIAITEAGEMALQGLVSATPPGTRLKRIEQYRGACSFCRKINGQIMTVAAPDKTGKDGHTEIWEGKTNIGRSQAKNKRTENGLVSRKPSKKRSTRPPTPAARRKSFLSTSIRSRCHPPN